MTLENIRIMTAYNGGVKCELIIDGIKHILEIEDIEKYIIDTINKNGYETKQEPRQKYKRIVLKV